MLSRSQLQLPAPFDLQDHCITSRLIRQLSDHRKEIQIWLIFRITEPATTAKKFQEIRTDHISQLIIVARTHVMFHHHTRMNVVIENQIDLITVTKEIISERTVIVKTNKDNIHMRQMIQG